MITMYKVLLCCTCAWALFNLFLNEEKVRVDLLLISYLFYCRHYLKGYLNSDLFLQITDLKLQSYFEPDYSPVSQQAVLFLLNFFFNFGI